MSLHSRHVRIAALWLLPVALMQACNISIGSPASAPGVNAQTRALQLQATAMALQMMQTAMSSKPQAPSQNQSAAVPAPNTAPQSAPLVPPVQQPPSSGAGGIASGGPQVSPVASGSFCRAGPDVSFKDVSFVLVGQTAQIVGRNSSGTWWLVKDPQNHGAVCWVAASGVAVSGSVAGVPIVQGSNQPSAVGISPFVDFAPPATVFCGDKINTVNFSGAISTNGSATVTYQWELRGRLSQTSSPETVNFGSGGGSVQLPPPDAIRLDCGDYSITLHVLSPIDTSATKNFTLQDTSGMSAGAVVGNITVDLTTPRTVTCGSATNQVVAQAAVTADGAATVTYRWELAGDASVIGPTQTLTFTSSGTQAAADPGALSLDCGDYTIALHVLTPNDLIGFKDAHVHP